MLMPEGSPGATLVVRRADGQICLRTNRCARRSCRARRRRMVPRGAGRIRIRPNGSLRARSALICRIDALFELMFV